jgi:hypothetical protein
MKSTCHSSRSTIAPLCSIKTGVKVRPWFSSTVGVSAPTCGNTRCRRSRTRACAVSPTTAAGAAAGDIVRYLARNGTGRIARVAMVCTITPFLVQTADNPDGVDRSAFDGMIAALEKDRPSYLAASAPPFFGTAGADRAPDRGGDPGQSAGSLPGRGARAVLHRQGTSQPRPAPVHSLVEVELASPDTGGDTSADGPRAPRPPR